VHEYASGWRRKNHLSVMSPRTVQRISDCFAYQHMP
jgi:hypothetical protein